VELLRLAELLSGLSMVADVGMCLDPGGAGRATLVAIALCEMVGETDASEVDYVTLLQHLGCTAYAHEAAALLGKTRSRSSGLGSVRIFLNLLQEPWVVSPAGEGWAEAAEGEHREGDDRPG
jgi:hypothetical protein